MSAEPSFEFPTESGSDPWQEGRVSVLVPASELTDEQVSALDASERLIAYEWRHSNDHEATIHNIEPPSETTAECERA